jgi:hypothetical protein
MFMHQVLRATILICRDDGRSALLMSGRRWHSETEMGALAASSAQTGVQSRLCGPSGHLRRDGHLTEAVVHDARRSQSRDRLRSPIESPPGIAWPAGILMARPGHSRKATARRTTKVASLFDMKALNLDDPEHGKDCERGGHR